jgi:hypothetical protein
MTIDTVYWVHTLSPILGFIAYFFVIDKVPRQNHLMFAYLVICFFADVITYLQLLPAPFVFNIHDICQFTIVIMIYVALFKERGVFFLVIIILVYVAALVATITLMGLSAHQNHMWALSGFLLSILCLVYVNVVNIWPKEFASDKDLYNTLIMNTSFLFYFMATFLFFLLSDWMFKEMSPEMLNITWAYHNAIGLIKNIGLAVAILLTGKAHTNTSAR